MFKPILALDLHELPEHGLFISDTDQIVFKSKKSVEQCGRTFMETTEGLFMSLSANGSKT